MKFLEEYPIEEYYNKVYGVTMDKPIRIEKIENVLEGKNLEKALRFKENFCTPKNCHYNSGMSTMWDYEGYDLSFCEGIADGIDHCWTCLTNKETGEKRYIDFTLDRECNAYLFNEWDKDDIMQLFDTCKYAFIPYREMYMYIDKNKKTRRLYKKYYPNAERVKCLV